MLKMSVYLNASICVESSDLDLTRPVTALQPFKTMAYRVDNLLRRKFNNLELEEQIMIVLLGKPRPELIRFYVVRDMQTLPFTQESYDQDDWLTACSLRKKLFCWPCLLFGAFNEWSGTGVASPVFARKLREHSRSCFHLHNSLLMAEFKAKHILEPKPDLNNYLVRRNRRLLTRVVEAVTFLAVQKGRTVNPPSVKECIEAVHFLSGEEDPAITEDALFLLKNKYGFLECVVDAMRQALILSIKKEVQGKFVSVILSGHGRDSSGNVLRSTVLRYVKNNRACERFVGFYLEFGDGKLFHQYLSKIVEDYQFAEKMVALAVDGMCSFSVINSLQCRLVAMYPYAEFVPCYFHSYWDVMVQFLCYREKTTDSCEIASFFDMIDSLVSFLKDHRQDVQDSVLVNPSELDSYDSARNPDVLAWIKLRRKELIRFFSLCDKRKGNEAFQVTAFLEFLSNYLTVFWLTLFAQAFHITQDLHRLDPDTVLTTDFRLKNILAKLNTKNGGQFDQQPILDTNVDFFGPAPPETQQYFVKYRDIFDKIHAQTYCRLGHLQNVGFCQLLNHFSVLLDHAQLQELVNSLKAHGSGFSTRDLGNEMLTLYSCNQAALRFTVEELIDYMTHDYRQKAFPNLVKLAELVLTRPCVRPLDPRSPLIDKIRANVRPDLAKTDCASGTFYDHDFSVLSVESELLQELRRRDSFCDEVVGRIVKDMNMPQLKT